MAPLCCQACYELVPQHQGKELAELTMFFTRHGLLAPVQS
jgi:hypothetical protein